MKLTILTVFFFFSKSIYSQMAQPSLFSSERSANPAILKWRKNGVFRTTLLTQSIVRKQNISTIKGSSFPLNQKDKIRILDLGLFRGGKGDNGFTTEFKTSYTMGNKEVELIDGNNKSSSFVAKGNSGNVYFSFATESFGTELHALNYNGNFKLNDTLNSQSFDKNENVSMVIYGIRQGFTLGDPSFGLGLIFEFDRLRPKGSIEGVSSQLYYVGLGIGFGSDFRFETNVEVDPISDISTHIPIKLSGIWEMKIGHFTFGYKGVWYEGKFIDLNQFVPEKLIYNNIGGSRMEHNIDISFGNESGFDFGWMGMYTETTGHEASAIFGGSEKHYTYSKNFSFKFKLGHSF